MSTTLQMIRDFGHEEVAFFNNEKAGLKCIVGIHSTKLGPALGGCRLWPYKTEEDALFDVLRLSRGMSFKNAAAGLPIGGGKGVIIADPSMKSQELFEAYGECVDSLQGRYLTAEDVNTCVLDMTWVLNKTEYVVGRDGVTGDPSPFTALGCFEGIKATAKFINGSDDLNGVKIALQGLGHVGLDLAKRLAGAGAELIITTQKKDARVDEMVNEFGAAYVEPEAIYSQECDIFAPCALGAIVNKDTLPQFKCRAIAGAANNVLFDDECGVELKKKGIVYAPDFIINAGGVINAGQEAFTTYDVEKVTAQVKNIYNTVTMILEESKATGTPEGVIAQKFAEDRIENGLG